MKILFICTGNTCRSPMAEGIMKVIARKENLPITCGSAGLCAFSGREPSLYAIDAARKFGAFISNHRSRSFTPDEKDDWDLFVVMTKSHKTALEEIIPGDKIRVLSVGIPDPYGKGEEEYFECANYIYNGIMDLVAELKEVKIHQMTAEDVEFIAQTEKESFSLPWSEKAISDELQNESARFYILESSLQKIGYIGMHIVLDECYIANIAIKNELRKKGYGKALLDFAIQKAREESCSFISLEVRKSNTPAKNLYEKAGFEIIGERKNFYDNPTEDADIMTKYLK